MLDVIYVGIMQIEFQRVLNALDGVAYLASPEGNLIAVNDAWDEVKSNAPQRHDILNCNLFSMISSQEVRDIYTGFHKKVLLTKSPIIFSFRCDTPELKRTLRMAITCFQSDNYSNLVLYHSQFLSVDQRPPIAIFDCHSGISYRELSNRPFLRICSFCHKLNWPDVSLKKTNDWIEPEEYYRRGGSSEITLSHGVCFGCRDRLKHAS